MVFEWADAFNPQRKRLAWLFEHKPSQSLGMVRAWRSWGRALIPPYFWRSVTPAHATSPVVLLWPVVVFLSFGAVGGCVRAAYLYIIDWRGNRATWSGNPPSGWALLKAVIEEGWVTPFFDERYRVRAQYGSELGHAAALYANEIATLTSALITGLLLMSLTNSRRICGVKTGHITRAMVYRLAPLGAFCVARLSQDLIEYAYFPATAYSRTTHAWQILGPACLLWGCWWWMTVLMKGWVMPRAWLAAALIGALDVLVGLTTCVILRPLDLPHFF